MLRSFRSLVAASAVAAMVLAPAVVTASTPPQNGCPASAELVLVSSFGEPYHLPTALDSTANGGNGDGYICAFPLPEALATIHNGVTIYQFFENNLTSNAP